MPSELYNWDRRKHEGAVRWRERSFQHHHYSSDNHPYTAPRWGSNFYRREISGHGKQGSKNLYVDEFGHGLMPSRPTEKMPGDDSYRPSGSGRYGRYSRENRGSSVQKDWKAHTSEIASQPNGSGKLKSTTDQRPVDVMPSHVSSTPSSDSIDSREPSLSKYQHENNDVGSMGSTGQKLERENSLTSINWKPLKWTRSESLSLRNSGFSHSSSSKSLEPDSSDMKTELMQENVTSVLSPPGAATAGFAAETPNAAAEVTNSRKKPRLGWGEGLAKYEKKKVESSDESEKNGATTYGSNVERSRSYASNCSDKSPKLVMVPQCASPATPSSVACSSSHGMEEKQVMKIASTDHDSAYICNSPSVTQRSFDLGELDLTTNFDLKSSIEELLKSDDPTLDSSFVRSTAMNKLLLLKNHISKEVETTETEIDLLENELKTMISGSGRSENDLYASRYVPVASLSKPYDHSAAPNVAVRLAGLHVVVDSNVASKDDHLVLKDVDVDSPGSATSKFVDVSLRKDAFPPIMSSEIEVIGDSGLSMSNREMEPEIDRLIEEKPITDGIGSRLVGFSSVSSGDDSLNIFREDFSRELILASKRDCEQIASEMISKLLPSSGYHCDFSSVVKASCVQNDLVKKRFLRKMYYYKLKEKILTLKFKILWHLWKEDMHIRYLKKLRGRAQKKFELSSRKSYRSYQKYRPSVHSGYFSTGASLLASTEQLSYASSLLAEPQIKPLRSVLKMPSMIIDRRERMASRFISYNGLMEDPLAAEKDRPIIKSWSEEDEELFIDKLTEFGKDFKKIAISLGRKTTDCVEFYYKNHKSDAFKRAKKKPEFSEHSTMPYLLTSGQRLNLEADAASQKIYGGASVVASMIDDFVEIQQKHRSKSFLASGSCKMESGGDNLVGRSSSQCFYDNERETVAADVLAGICCSLSSEAMNSCITSSLDPGGGYQDHKYQIIGPSTRRPLTPEVIQNVVETCTDESCGEMDPTDWTDEEKTLLIQAVATYGKDFTMISRCVRTKTHDQCKVFFSKARKCLGLDKTCSGSENMITDDVNGGRSDACFLESGSVICNGKSTLRIDEDVASVNLKLGHDTMKPDLHSAQGIVVGEMDCTHSLASKNLLPVDQRMEKNFELALEGNDASRNSAVLASNLDAAHGAEQGMMEVETVQCSCKPLIPEASNVSQHLGRDFRLHSCHSRKYASSDAELASAHHEGDPSVPPSGSQPYIEKLSTNGDVKLFGQILGKTSQHKAYSSAPLGEVCSSQHHSLGSESSSVKCSGSQQAADGISSHMNNNRIPNGASTLPHSTILLARYPTAFGNYVLPSSKIELPSSNGVVKSGECSLNGVPTLSNKDGVSNGSADLHIFRNQELQSLSILAQMERNGFDVSPGLQQQSGDMVAINVVGRKTVLGGQFVGVSDPVAAIKMHYAKSEQQQFSGGRLTANIIREDDPWRGKGNVGR